MKFFETPWLRVQCLSSVNLMNLTMIYFLQSSNWFNIDTCHFCLFTMFCWQLNYPPIIMQQRFDGEMSFNDFFSTLLPSIRSLCSSWVCEPLEGYISNLERTSLQITIFFCLLMGDFLTQIINRSPSKSHLENLWPRRWFKNTSVFLLCSNEELPISRLT